MVVSLYVGQIPDNVTQEDIVNIFSELEGYIDSRLKTINQNKRIAFIDFDNERNACFAKSTLQGFQFTEKDKGIVIQYSNNKKYNKSEQRNFPYNSRKDDFKKGYRSPHMRERSRSQSEKNGYKGYKELPYNSNINPINQPENVNTVSEPQQITSPNMFDESSQTAQILENLKVIFANTQNLDMNNNASFSQPAIKFDSIMESIDNDFQNFDTILPKATNIVYVEGIPLDATEREVSHIFRPFPGYKSLRLIQKTKNGQNTILCFADFENSLQSTICINTLQGYRFDKKDLVGLHCSYGMSKNKRNYDN